MTIRRSLGFGCAALLGAATLALPGDARAQDPAQAAAPAPAAVAAPAAQAAAAPAATTTPAASQVAGMPPGETDQIGGRTLSGHTFQRGYFVDSPFITPYFGIQTRIGYETATVPSVTKGQQPFNTNRVNVTQAIGGGVQIGSRVQLSLDADYDGTIGTDTNSIFFLGGDAGFDISPGVRVLLLRSDRYGSYLSVHPAGIIALHPGVVPANLFALAQAEISALTGNQKRLTCLFNLNFRCAFPSFDILGAVETQSLSYGGELAVDYAQAIGPYFGFQASAQLSVTASSFKGFDINGNGPGKPGSKTVNTVPIGFTGGVGPSLNLYPQAPLAITAEYAPAYKTASSDGTTGSDITHNVSAGLHYSGRRDLQLGLGFTASFVNKGATESNGVSLPSLNETVIAGAFDLVYYF